MKREIFEIDQKNKFPIDSFGNKRYRKSKATGKKKEHRFVRRKMKEIIDKLSSLFQN